MLLLACHPGRPIIQNDGGSVTLIVSDVHESMDSCMEKGRVPNHGNNLSLPFSPNAFDIPWAVPILEPIQILQLITLKGGYALRYSIRCRRW